MKFASPATNPTNCCLRGRILLPIPVLLHPTKRLTHARVCISIRVLKKRFDTAIIVHDESTNLRLAYTGFSGSQECSPPPGISLGIRVLSVKCAKYFLVDERHLKHIASHRQPVAAAAAAAVPGASSARDSARRSGHRWVKPLSIYFLALQAVKGRGKYFAFCIERRGCFIGARLPRRRSTTFTLAICAFISAFLLLWI